VESILDLVRYLFRVDPFLFCLWLLIILRGIGYGYIAQAFVRLLKADSQVRAREIMGRNFFGIEEAIKHFGVNPSREQLALLAEVPFTEEVLRSSKETHVLIAVFPLSVFDISGKLVDQELIYLDEWWHHAQSPVAKEKGKIGWQLVRKTPVSGSANKTWKKQQALLSSDEETPTAQVMVYIIIGHYLNTGEWLFRDPYVRTSSLDWDGYGVGVGVRGCAVLLANYWHGSTPTRSLGVAAAKKHGTLAA
jgi:hypothetical protein